MAAPEIVRWVFVKRCYELANDTLVVLSIILEGSNGVTLR